MAQHYIHKRIPVDVDRRLKLRKALVEREISKMSGQRVRVSMNKFLRYIANQETVYPTDFNDFIRRKRR